MKPDESLAAKALKSISSHMDYELLVSRPGITEPDSDFIWASTFKAPMGVSFIRDKIYFNLFLPEGSDSDGDKKLFLKRVGAKFQDELWQVRRSMDQVTGNYGPALKLAVSNFKSLVIDYSYIKKGRSYVHFIFNDAELERVSESLLSIANQLDGLRVEYLKKTRGEMTAFSVVDESDELSAVTIEINPPNGGRSMKSSDAEISFVMGNVLEDGVKTVGTGSVDRIPGIMMPENVSEIQDGLLSFDTCNPIIVRLVESMATEFIVVYGFYGAVVNGEISLTINVPTQQTPALLRILKVMSENDELWGVKLKEVAYFKDLIR